MNSKNTRLQGQINILILSKVICRFFCRELPVGTRLTFLLRTAYFNPYLAKKLLNANDTNTLGSPINAHSSDGYEIGGNSDMTIFGMFGNRKRLQSFEGRV